MKLILGQRVELELLREGWKGIYKTRVEDVDGDKLRIGVPYARGRLIPIKNGEQVAVIFADQVAAYRFIATIENTEYEHLALFDITHPQKENIQRIQRRKHVRVDIMCPCAFRRLGQDEELNKCVTVDFSGGGVKFISKIKIESGTKLYLLIELPILNLECTGEVIRTLDDGPKRYDVCVKFLELDQAIVDKLVSWVFKYQLELRKKGLL